MSNMGVRDVAALFKKYRCHRDKLTVSLFKYLFRRLGFDPWVRKIPGEGNDNPLQYSCPENPMDQRAW